VKRKAEERVALSNLLEQHGFYRRETSYKQPEPPKQPKQIGPPPLYWQSMVSGGYMTVTIPSDIDAASRDHAVAILGLVIRRLEGMEFEDDKPPRAAEDSGKEEA